MFKNPGISAYVTVIIIIALTAFFSLVIKHAGAQSACPAGNVVTADSAGATTCGGTPATQMSGTTGNIGGGLLVALGCSSGTATVTGAAVGMPVSVSPSGAATTGSFFYGWVSSANTVTVNVCALVAVTPTAQPYNVVVF